MILAANQPYFFPYLGYWQLINAADLFLIADNLAFIRKGWIKRNRILINGSLVWFSLKVRDASSFRLIMDTEISAKNDFPNLLKTLEMAYHRAPHFADGYELVSRIFAGENAGKISPFLERSIREVCAYIGIDTPIGRTSDYPEDVRYRREQSLYYLCGLLGADTYVNLPGGQDLYRFDEFRSRGIRLRFIDPVLKPYPQLSAEFVPRLSILDVIMNNSRDAVHAMLSDFSYVDG